MIERCERLVSVSKSYLSAEVVCLVGNLIRCEDLSDTKKEMDIMFQQEASCGRKVLIYSEISNSAEEEAGINYDKILKALRNKDKAS